MRVLVFGDSITQGFSDSDGGWVVKLWEHYSQSGYEPTLFNLGVSGDTSADLLKRMEDEIKSRRWPGETQYAVIAIGVNDSQIEGDVPLMSVDQFRSNLQKLAKTASAQVENYLFVGLTPCLEAKTTPLDFIDVSFYNNRIKKSNEAIRKVAAENNVEFVDVLNSQQVDWGEILNEDGLHPNTNGHEVIAGLVKPYVDRMVSN